MSLNKLQTRFNNHLGEVFTKMQNAKKNAIRSRKIETINELKKRIKENNIIIKYESRPHLKDEARRINKLLHIKVKQLESEVYGER